MKKITVNTSYTERSNTYSRTTFDIVDSAPEIGAMLWGKKVLEIIPAHLDVSAYNEEEVCYMDFYEIKVLCNPDSTDPEEQFEDFEYIAVEQAEEDFE